MIIVYDGTMCGTINEVRKVSDFVRYNKPGEDYRIFITEALFEAWVKKHVDPFKELVSKANLIEGVFVCKGRWQK